MQQNRQLTGDGDNRSLLGIFSAARMDALTPLAQSTIRSVMAEYVVGALHEKFSQIAIAGLRNAKLRIRIAGLGCGAAGNRGNNRRPGFARIAVCPPL